MTKGQTRYLLPALIVAAASTASVTAAAQDAAHRPAPQGTNGNGGNGSAVDKVNHEADTRADQANRAVVGNQQQNQNNAEAAAPRKQPAKGATNMQRPDPTAVEAGQATTSAVNGVATGVKDVTRTTDRPGKYDPFAIEWNPLGMFVGGRVSFNLEWVPAVHHAIEVSPYIVHTTADVATSGGTTESQAFSGFGGELGYRYYTGHRGPNGVFIGPSLIAGAYNAGLPNGDQPFTNIGIAGDVGVQEIFFNHLVVGGGVGLEYLSVSHDFHDLPSGPSTIASSGVKPRLLLEAGYGF